METNIYSVSLAKNPKIAIKIISGHFTTGNAHSNNYIDYSELKCNAALAREVACELAIPYLSTTHIDTIVCMGRTDVIGAFLAQELLSEGASVINTGGEIYIVSPNSNTYGNLVFPNSKVGWINGKNILLLMPTVSSGRTLDSALECITYYGGKTVGVSALYLAQPEFASPEANKLGLSHPGINALFTSEDIPGYKLYSPGECEMCMKGLKLDAIINSEGYTKIE